MNMKEFAEQMQGQAKAIPLNANQMKIGLARTIDQTVVLATPVDTGRARANWQVGIGSAPGSPLEGVVDKAGGDTISKNDSAIQGAQLGQDIHLTNNVPYIERLNEGWSAQAPAGFVEGAIEKSIGAAAKWPILKE